MTAPIIFLSHTSVMARYPEGRSFVQAAKDAALRAGLSVSDMQFFPAADRPPAHVCQDAVRACRVYVGVFGHDYGSRVRERPDVSYTELEFLTAIEESRQGKMRVFIFLLCEDAPVGDLDTPESDQAAFRRRVCDDHSLTVKFFKDPASLELEVYHALRETRSAGRSPSLRRLAGWGAAAVLVASVVAVSFWMMHRGTDGPPPPVVRSSPPELKDLMIGVGVRGDDGRGVLTPEDRNRKLVAGGVVLDQEALPPLTDRDVFILRGTFDRPVYWSLLWFDTEARFEINDASAERTASLEYPSDGKFQTVSPKDPKGVHLLMLVAGDSPPAEGKLKLQQALGDMGRPPQTLPSVWGGVRGGGERVANSGEEISFDYRARVKRRLPPGFHAVCSIWLPTK